jgi:hypothetical protein
MLMPTLCETAVTVPDRAADGPPHGLPHVVAHRFSHLVAHVLPDGGTSVKRHRNCHDNLAVHVTGWSVAAIYHAQHCP